MIIACIGFTLTLAQQCKQFTQQWNYKWIRDSAMYKMEVILYRKNVWEKYGKITLKMTRKILICPKRIHRSENRRKKLSLRWWMCTW